MDALKQDVRKAPRDARLRTFLFQMFCITGEWDRALTQLSVAAELDPAGPPMAQTYTSAIRCEILREKVFRGERSPTVLGDPGSWLPLLIEATRLLATGQPDQAAKLRDDALDAAPETEGTLNETAFAWIADADPRLGPVLEVFINGNYMWVPFERVRALRLDPPADLRDQVWMPAHFTWSNDGEADGMIPTRYPGSASSVDPALALSRKTEWRDAGAGLVPADGPARTGHRCQRDGIDGHPRSGDHPGLRLSQLMSGLKGRERLQPSLLDRLTDAAPAQKRDGPDQQVLSMAQLRQAVLRDLGALFNTTNLATLQDLAATPLTEKSTLNYGIPGFAGMIESKRAPG